jgi:hypothetical protein
MKDLPRLNPAGLGLPETMNFAQRWIVQPAQADPPWETALRRELIAAYRRGTMDAERCLGTYLLQGRVKLLPPEAVVYLAASVTADRTNGTQGTLTAEALSVHAGYELATLYQLDRKGFEGLVEAGRRFFFPGR